MSLAEKDRAYVEHCLRQIEGFLEENDLVLAGLTLDLAHPDLYEKADDQQAERLQVILETLGRDGFEVAEIEQEVRSYSLH